MHYFQGISGTKKSFCFAALSSTALSAILSSAVFAKTAIDFSSTSPIDVSCVTSDGTTSLILEHLPNLRLDGHVLLKTDIEEVLFGAHLQRPPLDSLFKSFTYKLYAWKHTDVTLTVSVRPTIGRGGCELGGCNSGRISAKLVDNTFEPTTTYFHCNKIVDTTDETSSF